MRKFHPHPHHQVWWSKVKPSICLWVQSLDSLLLHVLTMSLSMVHPSVHPIEAPPVATEHAVIAVPRHTLKDTQGMPGTLGGFLLRFLQFSFALVSLSVMATTSDFPSVTAFRYHQLINKIIFFIFYLTMFFNWVCRNCCLALAFSTPLFFF